ncbi:MAG: DMT family transporter [Pseudomonadota bacterium]
MQRAHAVEFTVLAAVWGAAFLFMRVALVEFGPLPTALVRVTVAALVLLPLLLWRGFGMLVRERWMKIFAVGVLNSGMPSLLFAYALQSITTGLTAVLNATVPLFGALLAWTLLGDRPSRSRMAGLAIGFTGVALLAGGKAGLRPDVAPAQALLAVLACLGAALSYALAAAMAKRWLVGVPPLAVASGSLLGASIVFAVPGLLAWPTIAPSAKAWAAVAMAGSFCTAGTTLMYFRLIERIGPARSLAVTFVLPIFAAAYGMLFLGEPLTVWTVLCGAVVVCGTALAVGLLDPAAAASRRAALGPAASAARTPPE